MIRSSHGTVVQPPSSERIRHEAGIAYADDAPVSFVLQESPSEVPRSPGRLFEAAAYISKLVAGHGGNTGTVVATPEDGGLLIIHGGEPSEPATYILYSSDLSSTGSSTIA